MEFLFWNGAVIPEEKSLLTDVLNHYRYSLGMVKHRDSSVQVRVVLSCIKCTGLNCAGILGCVVKWVTIMGRGVH